jgi:hypothetical protein
MKSIVSEAEGTRAWWTPLSRAIRPHAQFARWKRKMETCEISRLSVVHRHHRGLQPPFAALRGPSRGAVE